MRFGKLKVSNVHELKQYDPISRLQKQENEYIKESYGTKKSHA